MSRISEAWFSPIYFRISSNALDTWIRCTEASRRSCSTCSRCCSSSRTCLSLAYIMVDYNFLPWVVTKSNSYYNYERKLEATKASFTCLTKATALSVLLSLLRVKVALHSAAYRFFLKRKCLSTCCGFLAKSLKLKTKTKTVTKFKRCEKFVEV